MGSQDCVTSTLRPTAQKELAGRASHEVERPESFLRRNALSLACLSAFLVLLVGMVLTGWHSFNSDQVQHGEARLSLWSYFAQGHIWEALFENWESEFLQMAAYVVLTAYLIQRGSAESKNPDQHEAVDDDPQDADRRHDVPWPVRRGGVVLKLYEHSLAIAFTLLFVGSMLGHALGGAAEYNDELRAHGEAAVSTWQYVDRVTVLVRVVPELAERVPCCVRDRCPDDLPAGEGLVRVEASRSATLRDWNELNA